MSDMPGLATRWPLLAMMDTGNHGHIGWADAIADVVARGNLGTRFLRRYVSSGAYAANRWPR